MSGRLKFGVQVCFSQPKPPKSGRPGFGVQVCLLKPKPPMSGRPGFGVQVWFSKAKPPMSGRLDFTCGFAFQNPSRLRLEDQTTAPGNAYKKRVRQFLA